MSALTGGFVFFFPCIAVTHVLRECFVGNDLLALICFVTAMLLSTYGPIKWKQTRWFCGIWIILRIFGFGSGIAAMVMAVERWLALRAPF